VSDVRAANSGQPSRRGRVTGSDERAGGWVGWAGVVLLCLCALAAAVLELLFVPLYIGPVVIPVSVLAAVAANFYLPQWGRELTGRAAGAVAPIAVWLVVIVPLSLMPRPEGDLFVLGVYGEKWNFYALLLFGSLAGFVGVVRGAPGVELRAPLGPRPEP
jgi:hypothetical protein